MTTHAYQDRPRSSRIEGGGLMIGCHEWPGEGDPILFVHATGFHSQCWRRVIAHLPGRHIFALDMPSHGTSDRKAPPYDPTGLSVHITEAIRVLGLHRVLGVGHSLGGHILVQAASRLKDQFRGLVLIDPVIVDPEVISAPERVRRAEEHPVSRRRNRWASAEEMFRHFRNREPYARWEPEVLRDYCEFGLVPAENGEGFELACPPLLEASVYAGMHMQDIFEAVAAVRVPVDIIRARSRQPQESMFDFSASPTWVPLVDHFSNATDVQLADRTHFIPMEIPCWTAERIAAMADSLPGEPRPATANECEGVELSLFGRRFCGRSGIGELMQDLGEALTLNPQMIFMGGGNPGQVPAAIALYRERLQAIFRDDEAVHRAVGIYQLPQGDDLFRRELARMLAGEFGWKVGPDNIAVCNGSQSAFFTLFNMFAGDFGGGRHRHIQLPLVPEYIGYTDIGLEDGLFQVERPVIEELPDQLFKYRVDFDRLRIGESAGAICVSRPTNPTGNVLSDAEMRQLDQLARRQGIPLIIDGAYGTPFPNMIFCEAQPLWNDNIVVVLSLSKLGLPGLRTGIIVAREEITAAFARANAILNLACGTVGPALGVELLRDNSLLSLGREHIGPFYRDKAERTLDAFRGALAGLPFRIHKPEGAMFLWLSFAGIPGGTRSLYQRLKRLGVLVVPGWSFFPGLNEEWAHRDECIRVSYAQDSGQVSRGVMIIADEVRRTYAEAG